MVRRFFLNCNILILTVIFFGVLSFFPNQITLAHTNSVTAIDYPKIAIFYGSDNDKRLSEEMILEAEIDVEYYNITSVILNSSFTFDNKSMEAIWWINELHLPIDFSFVGDLGAWTQSGKGLFILNRYFDKTPIAELQNLGITGYWPEVYPINHESQTHSIQLVNESLPSLQLDQLTYEFNGTSAWVDLHERTVVLAEITQPVNESYPTDFNSGLWLVQNKVVVGSFSVNLPLPQLLSDFKLMGMNSPVADGLVDVLGDIALLTTDAFSDSSGIFQISGFDQLVTVGIIGITAIISLIGLIKFGILARLRDLFLGASLGLFFFIAHIAYSPQKRRINEDDLLDNEMRMQIVEYLEEKGEQGAHLREIQRTLGCGISSLLWHLQALDDFNIVTHHKIGKYHIFYLTGSESLQISEIALALKSDVAKELCKVLLQNKSPLSLSKISSEINVHHSSIQHHVKRLSDLGIIMIIKEKKRSSYIINPNRVESLDKVLEVN
ncbi:MAG: HTH domain-containing protein [Candidatus Hodarchaeales archaeon]